VVGGTRFADPDSPSTISSPRSTRARRASFLLRPPSSAWAPVPRNLPRGRRARRSVLLSPRPEPRKHRPSSAKPPIQATWDRTRYPGKMRLRRSPQRMALGRAQPLPEHDRPPPPLRLRCHTEEQRAWARPNLQPCKSRSLCPPVRDRQHLPSQRPPPPGRRPRDPPPRDLPQPHQEHQLHQSRRREAI
jgi:hypothetical protein